MGNSISIAVPVLCVAISALELAILLDPQQTAAGTAAAAQAPPLHSAIWAFLPLVAAAGGLFASVSLLYLHFYRAAAAAGASNRRLPEFVKFMLCASAGFLHFFLYVQVTGGVGNGLGAARALGLAALRVLPPAATASFFLGMLLLIVGHIRAGGEGGGTAVAGHGPVEAPVVGLLVKMASEAAVALVFLMTMAAVLFI